MRAWCAGLFLLLCCGVVPARADVNLLLEEPINFLGGLTSAGHAVLWLDSVCSDDGLRVRACAAGEAGVTLSRYSGAAGYDWLAVPVMPYLFATDSAGAIPETASVESVAAMRTAYRARHEGMVPAAVPAELWDQLLGASYRRTILVVHLKTTPEEDARLLRWLQGRKNRSHFNIFWNNCADLSRQMLDVLYPGAVHRSFLYDAGIMTPEQVASSVARYARRHPELAMSVSVLPQVAGEIKRSGRMYGTTESFVKTKPYLLPLTVLNPIEFGVVIAAGLTDRRFDVQEHVKTAPVLAMSELEPGPEETAATDGADAAGAAGAN